LVEDQPQRLVVHAGSFAEYPLERVKLPSVPEESLKAIVNDLDPGAAHPCARPQEKGYVG
jgi:hypothetical protein